MRIFYTTLFFLLFLLMACRKDKVPFTEIISGTADTCDCVPVELPNGYTTGLNFINDSVYYRFPSFNPNNENEIIFTVVGSGANELIYKYNLVTHSKSLVFEGVIFGEPKWGKSGWIIFTRGYAGVYRVKPDGTNLSLLIPGGLQFNPEFNQSGDKILTFHGFPPSNDIYQTKIWNNQGGLIDSLNFNIGHFSRWSNQKNIASIVVDSLVIIDPETKNVVRRYPYYFDVQDNKVITDFVWLNEDQALVGKNGLYKLNVWSGQKEKITCGCSSRFYTNGDANEAGTKVLFNKQESKIIAENTLKVRISIVLFDVTTNTFEEVEIQ